MQTHSLATKEFDDNTKKDLKLKIDNLNKFHSTILAVPSNRQYKLVEDYIRENQTYFLGNDDNSTLAKLIRPDKIKEYFSTILIIISLLAPDEQIKVIKQIIAGIKHSLQLISFIFNIYCTDLLTLEETLLSKSTLPHDEKNPSLSLEMQTDFSKKLRQDLPRNFSNTDLNILTVINLFETKHLQQLIKSWEDLLAYLYNFKHNLKIALLKKLGNDHVIQCIQNSTTKSCGMNTLTVLRDAGFLEKIYEKTQFSTLFYTLLPYHRRNEKILFYKSLDVTILEKFSKKNSLVDILKSIEPECHADLIRSVPSSFLRKFCTQCPELTDVLCVLSMNDQKLLLTTLVQTDQATPFLIQINAKDCFTFEQALRHLSAEDKALVFENTDLSTRLKMETLNQAAFHKILKTLPVDKIKHYISLSNLLFYLEKNIKAYENEVHTRTYRSVPQSLHRESSIIELRARIAKIINDSSSVENKVLQIIALIKAHLNLVKDDHNQRSLFSFFSESTLSIAYQKTLHLFPLEMVAKIKACNLANQPKSTLQDFKTLNLNSKS